MKSIKDIFGIAKHTEKKVVPFTATESKTLHGRDVILVIEKHLR